MPELNHAVSGDARLPVALFLHGFMGSAGDWRDVAGTLNQRYRCVAVDLPGHGSSLRLPTKTYTMGGAARAVLGVLDGLGARRAAVVGYSMGGRLALYLALRQPQRCSRLLLESASPGIGDAAERRARRAADEGHAARLESGDFDAFLRDWYEQPLFASLAKNTDLLSRTIEARRNNDPAELARSLRGMGTGSAPSLWGELANLRTPTLALAGELDEKFAKLARRMQASTPHLHSALVPRAGHNVRLEARDTYSQLLEEFLQR